jgi:putative oxygen-independent coproporphyrinogen III oxidase
VHVYCHVPFCVRRCSYCDFAIAVRREVPSDAYVAALLREWSAWLEHPAWAEAPGVSTIYFGGGTPSLLAPGGIAALLERMRADRPVEADAEITLEANPDDVTPAAARAWRAAGVTRLSLGAQSFSADALRWMHRTHDAAAIERAVDVARAAGIADLSMDLIFALPADVPRSWEADLDRALALAPDHVSLYGLTTEPRTPLARWTAAGRVRPADDARYAADYLLAHERLEAAGLEHYEVSNAGRPGHHARHNSAYWRRAPYIGLGPSAHSGFGRQRRWNLREWVEYERAVTRGEGWVAGEETLDADAVRLEEVYLGLRTLEGVPRAWVAGHYATEWAKQGWAQVGQETVRLTVEGWLRLDALAAAL